VCFAAGESYRLRNRTRRAPSCASRRVEMDLSQDMATAPDFPIPPTSHRPAPNMTPPPDHPLHCFSSSPAVTPGSLPSLSEIARLLRAQSFHKRRCQQATENLRNLQLAAARVSRLVRVSQSVHHTLADCIRQEDEPSFVSLSNALLDSCDASPVPPPPSALATNQSSSRDTPLSLSFFKELSATAQATVLDLLAKLRYDDGFVATQIASLAHRDLMALLSDHASPSRRTPFLAPQAGPDNWGLSWMARWTSSLRIRTGLPWMLSSSFREALIVLPPASMIGRHLSGPVCVAD